MDDLTINQEELTRCLQVYNGVTRLPVTAIDTTGKPIASAGGMPPFCKLFTELTGDKCPCQQAHLNAGKQSELLGEAYVYFCPAGLVHWTAPILTKGLMSGILVSGMVQMNISDPFFLDNIIKVYDLPVSGKGKLEAYLGNIPVIEPEKVRYLADMLHLVTKALNRDYEAILDERRQYYKEQRLLGESIQMIKSRESTSEISAMYPVAAERHLLNRVRIGDKAGAKVLLNDILGYIFFQYAGNLEMMTARGLELLVVISRAAIEGGADPNKIFELTRQYLVEMPKIHSVDRLGFLIVKVLDQFTGLVFPVGSPENATIIKTAIAYINDHYKENITLKAVADTVYLSPAYFSRLFKNKIGMNFSSYLNNVRVEESKKYLMDLDLPLSDIGPMVGFYDQSYYNKVFKKVESISPGQFRKNMG